MNHLNNQGRWFYRCPECLCVNATEGRIPASYQTVCGLCSHRGLDEMGKVSGSNLVNERDRTPCDNRCTSATGPNCECACGGANHGSGCITEVIIVGGVPHLASQQNDKLLARLAEFRAAKNAAENALIAKIGFSVYEKLQARQWVDNKNAWCVNHYFWLRIRKAEKCRQHKARMMGVEKAVAGLG